MSRTALLALEDGSIFHGISIGASGTTVGEVVFNTSMTGYQEILTDPSYAEQIVTLTYPHIGNVGTNSEDAESELIWSKGLVIRDLPLLASSFRNELSLSAYLKERNIVAIADIDTRRLTRLLRTKGALNGAILTVAPGESLEESRALSMARSCPSIKGADLASRVSTGESYPWVEGTWTLKEGYAKAEKGSGRFKVVAYDFGVKRNIFRLLVDRGCDVQVVPAQTPVEKVLAENPDGVFLSNGPGDPEACTYAIQAVKELLSKNIPMFGICLGYQLLALASGARTEKMKFGHHGANHPVKNLLNNTVDITSQNHGFAVDEDSCPDHLEITHRSLFDNTIQGLRHKQKPAFGFQGHPEASPGPQDPQYLFDQFVNLMREQNNA